MPKVDHRLSHSVNDSQRLLPVWIIYEHLRINKEAHFNYKVNHRSFSLAKVYIIFRGRKCTSGVLHWNILKAMFKYGYTWISFCTRELKTVILPSIFFRAVWQASSLANSNGLLHVRTLSHSHLPSIMLQPVTKFSLHGSNPKSWSSSQFSSEQGSKGKKYLSS